MTKCGIDGDSASSLRRWRNGAGTFGIKCWGKWFSYLKFYYFCSLEIRINSMTGSRENLMLSLSTSPRTAFNTKSVALLLNEKRDVSLTKRLNYYVKRGLLLNPRKGIYAKKNPNVETIIFLLLIFICVNCNS